MSFVETSGKFHISLDGIGLLLQGAGEHPAYRVQNAPVYGTRFASGDRDYNDLSQWWYLIQTDWSGGIKDEVSFEDDAKFYYSTNIDTFSQPGSLRLPKRLVQERDVSGVPLKILDVRRLFFNDTSTLLYLNGEDASTMPGGIVTASSGASSVRSHTVFKNYYWQFYIGAAIYNYDGTTDTNQANNIGTVIDGSISETFCGVVVGENLFVCGRSNAGKIFWVKTSVANPVDTDWTLVSEISFPSTANVIGAEHIGGEIIYLVERTNGSNVLGLYSLDVSSNVVSLLREFAGNTTTDDYTYGNRYVRLFQNKVLITIPHPDSSMYGSIYSLEGGILTLIFSTNEKKLLLGNEASVSLRGGCVVAGDLAFWGNLVYDGERFYNFIKTFDDDQAYPLIPVGYDADTNKLYLCDTETEMGIAWSYDFNDTSYKTGASNTAFIVLSQHDKLQSIDKLFNTITIGFEKMLSGQAISVYYTTNQTPNPNITTGSWTLLGTASYAIDGGTVVSKVLNFPVGIVAKKMWFRIELSSGGSDTPTVNDLTVEYLPMPDYRFQWTLNINCADEVNRIDGRKTETTARELKARIMKAWQTKSALDFGDIDYAQTAINDATPAKTDTTITVDTTAFFPEQGRIKIDDEEVYYTNKTPTSFTGCTRGARGTLAVDHADNAVVHNGYRVLVIDIDIRVPVLLEDKNIEYIAGITLREV